MIIYLETSRLGDNILLMPSTIQYGTVLYVLHTYDLLT